MHSDPASRAFLEAFPYTVPIFAGFWFVAFAYGFYMHSLGFSPLYPMIMAMIIFGGSPGICCRHHAAVPFAPLQTLLVVFTIQARHLFTALLSWRSTEAPEGNRLYHDRSVPGNLPGTVDEGREPYVCLHRSGLLRSCPGSFRKRFFSHPRHGFHGHPDCPFPFFP